jgi:hypothetical protein
MLAKSADLAAAPAAAALTDIGWSYLLGLAAIIAFGAVGAYYARMPLPEQSETGSPADKFEIE